MHNLKFYSKFLFYRYNLSVFVLRSSGNTCLMDIRYIITIELFCLTRGRHKHIIT